MTSNEVESTKSLAIYVTDYVIKNGLTRQEVVVGLFSVVAEICHQKVSWDTVIEFLTATWKAAEELHSQREEKPVN